MTEETKPKPPADVDVVTLREYPKVIFFYPSVLVAALCVPLAMKFAPSESPHAATIGLVFTAIFIFNLLVITFDFNNMVALTSALSVFALALLAYVVNQTWQFLPSLARFFSGLRIEMSWHFYFVYALAFAIVYAVVWVIRRFYYIEIKSNEILYHQGLFGDVERHDTRGLKQTKEINDLFELLLWRSGRLVLHVSGRTQPYILENVPNVNRAERLIQRVTSRQSVEIEPPG